MDTTTTTLLDFAALTEDAVARMRKRYAGHEVKVINVEKNNGVCLTGIAIVPADSNGETSLFPTIYLNELYEEYLDGTPMEKIADRIADCYEANKGVDAAILPDILHFDEVKDTICYRLINAELNAETLNKIPYRAFLDLAMVYCIPVDMGDGSRGSITVTNDYAHMWKVDEERIHACAAANTDRLYPAELRTMEDVVQELIPGCDMSDIDSGMFILRNYVGSGGAGALFRKDILRGFADEHGDFYIIPSSICEVILLPLSNAMKYVTKESIPCMVRDVNKNNVAPEEVLSNNAYLYHAGTGEIEILS